jgi:hypothetical protein
MAGSRAEVQDRPAEVQDGVLGVNPTNVIVVLVAVLM